MVSKRQLGSAAALLFAAILGFGMPRRPATDDPLLSRTAPAFNSTNEAAISAILRFGREGNLPLGLVLSERLCSASLKELRINRGTVRAALDQLSSALPSYNWSLEHGTVVLAPVVVPAAAAEFLAVPLNPYLLPEDTLQAQAAYEWLNIRGSLRPNEGTAFSVLSSKASPKWPALSLGSTTIKDALDRIVARSPGGAWILSPIDDIGKAAESRPFQLVDYSNPEDALSPCGDPLGP
jgi:hypothetical protein